MGDNSNAKAPSEVPLLQTAEVLGEGAIVRRFPPSRRDGEIFLDVTSHFVAG